VANSIENNSNWRAVESMKLHLNGSIKHFNRDQSSVVALKPLQSPMFIGACIHC